MAEKKFRIGFASFAHMHSYSYLAALQDFKDVEIAGVAEENEDAKSAVKQLPFSQFSSYHALCTSPDIDCILITTENVHHAQVAIDALEHGKHVIVEKPMATTLQDAEAMLSAAKKSSGKLVQCYPCRYHPTSQIIKQEFQKGTLGQILAISATNHGQMPAHEGVNKWFTTKALSGGGALMDHITHVADLIFWYSGAKLKSIYAINGNLFHPNVPIDDAGMVLIEYENQMKASIDPSWSRPVNFATWGDVTMTIMGTKKTVTWDMFAQSLDIHQNHATHPIWHNYGSNMDAIMLRDFVNHLKENQQPMLSGQDGKNALQVALAAYESIEKHKVIQF